MDTEQTQSDAPVKLGKLYYNRPDKAKMDYNKSPDFMWTIPEKKKQDKKGKTGGIQERMASIKARPSAKRAVDVGISKVSSNV